MKKILVIVIFLGIFSGILYAYGVFDGLNMKNLDGMTKSMLRSADEAGRDINRKVIENAAKHRFKREVKKILYD